VPPAGQQETPDDALEGVFRAERHAHLTNGEPEVGAGMQLERLGLGVAQTLGDVLDL